MSYLIRPAMPEDGAFIGKCVCEGIGFEIFNVIAFNHLYWKMAL